MQRSYPMPPQVRRTVYAGDIPELVNRSFGTTVRFTNGPGAAERAMYFGSPVFNGGHESAGVTRPATDWFLAEGATGLVLHDLRPAGEPERARRQRDADLPPRRRRHRHARRLVLPASSRRTINVALEDASLAATSVATRITSDVADRRRALHVLAVRSRLVAGSPQRLRRDGDGLPVGAGGRPRWRRVRVQDVRAGRQPRPDRREPHRHVPADGWAIRSRRPSRSSPAGA